MLAGRFFILAAKWHLHCLFKVLVNVKAVGLNPVDTYIRSGSFMKPPLPYTPGSDGAGIVKEVGSDVTKYKVKGILTDYSGDFL